ncbi:hypothetical protein L211DRAFT_789437, partial [Terfezia boudieri ATCC MYA-4762]
YPKHVWSPTGGWYSRPSNWRSNTAIVGATIAGLVMVVWSYSAKLEQRDRFPERDRPFPSRLWARQIIEKERAEDEAAAAAKAAVAVKP